MSDILSDLTGAVCLVDDILIYGSTQEEHDKRLKAVLARIRDAGPTLIEEKCEFNKSSVKFLGQLVDENGARPDPEKVVAIQEMKRPESITKLCRFLGMVNQSTNFSLHLHLAD